MFCPDCGTRNPSDNRFCGMCGERLPARTERADRTASSKPSPAVVTPPATETPHTEKWVEAPASAANPAISSSAAAGEPPSRALVDSLPARPQRDLEGGRRPVATASSSFLGLGSAEARSDRAAVSYDEYDPPQREISWRFWALMLVLLGVVALFGLQWRAHRLNANQVNANQGSANPAKPDAGVAEQGVAPPAPQSSPSDDLQQPGSNNSPASSSAVTADQADKPQDKGKGAQTPERQPDKPNPAETKPPKGTTAKSRAADDDSDAADDDATAPNEATPRSETARESSDAPVTQADSLIAAGDCNGAVRVLRAAGQNPRALTKLGAMYLTGTCVEADRATAYAWFSQAFNADPHNLRLESTRRTIWSQMTDTERAKVESGVRTR